MQRLLFIGSVALLGLALPALPGCPEDELVDVRGGVVGQVCNPVTGRPAVDATISVTFVNETTQQTLVVDATTNDTGTFTLRGVATGKQTLHVDAADFENDLDVDVPPNGNAQLVDPACRDLAPPPGKGILVGQVCNRHTGSFVTGAEVLVLLPDGSQLTTMTDPTDGTFELEVPAGTHVVYVRAPGFQKTYQVEIKDGEQTLLDEQTRVCAPPDPLTTGIIRGTICAPDPAGGDGNGGPLAGARVYLVQPIDGVVYEDETLEDGSFLIADVPAPQVGLQVRAEKGGFVYTWDDVAVQPRAQNDQGTLLTATDQCQPLEADLGRRYLVVDGTFDKIQDVLDRMGLQNVDIAQGVPLDPTALWTLDVFSNYDQLQNYDVVFVNCGVSEIDYAQGISAPVKANIRRFIEEGGSLYVSDWAYELIEQVFAERIDFLRDDTALDAAQYGMPGVYTADVVEPGLRDHLGADTVDIDFNFLGSVIISQVSSGVQVFLKADMQYEVNGGAQVLPDTPITVGFRQGLGRVVFTSFHQENSEEGLEELDGPEDLVLRYIVFSL